MTGGVRLTKRVTEREETVDEPLLRADVQVERVPINRVVTEAPQARQEGDTLVVPILEEVLVVEKRLMLKEEVRITRTQTEVHQPQAVTLRMEEAVIEGITPDAPPIAINSVTQLRHSSHNRSHKKKETTNGKDSRRLVR